MFRNIILDCHDPEALATFWVAASGFERRGGRDPYVVLVDPAQPSPRLVLQRVSEPKQGKNRLHLDLEVPDLETEVQRLEALGARRLQRQEEFGPFWVMQDPEGNEFCVVQARKR